MANLRYIDLHAHTQRRDPNTVSVLDIPLSDWNLSNKISESTSFSISLHPCKVDKQEINSLKDWIKQQRCNPNWIALGEAGFDPQSPLSPQQQLQLFLDIATLAEQEQKFLIVHCVKMFAQLHAAYQTIRPKQTWVLHGFRKNNETMHQWLLPNIAFSIGLHQPKNLITDLPLDRLFFETDDQNSLSIEQIYWHFAQKKALPIDQLKQQIENNYNRITKKNKNNELC